MASCIHSALLYNLQGLLLPDLQSEQYSEYTDGSTGVLLYVDDNLDYILHRYIYISIYRKMAVLINPIDLFMLLPIYST